jgi:hypothetical protein
LVSRRQPMTTALMEKTKPIRLNAMTKISQSGLR